MNHVPVSFTPPGEYEIGVNDPGPSDGVNARPAHSAHSDPPWRDLLSGTYSLLADLVSLPGVDAGYLRSLRSSITVAQQAERKEAPLALLPMYACYMVGGEPSSALPAAAAWRALHLAAKLLDDIEDSDASSSTPALDFSSSSASQAPHSSHPINTATGLFSAAGLALLRLEPRVQGAVLPLFYKTILVMSSGQHVDFATSRHSLDDYLRVVAAKTGSFFALAGSTGARCGTDDERLIALLDTFGFNVGIFLQIADDYLDWHKPGSGDVATGSLSLPACYIRAVGTEEQQALLEQLLIRARMGGQDAHEAHIKAQNLATETGADGFILAELVRYRLRAFAALEELERHSLDTQPLVDWFSRLSAFVSS